MVTYQPYLLTHSLTLKILDSIPAIIYISDNAGKTIQWCNKYMTDESGYTFQEIHRMGIDFFKAVMHPDDFPDALAAQQHFFNSKEPFGGACRMRAKNRLLWKWMIGIAAPFSYSDDGHVKDVICIFQKLSYLLDTPSQLSEAFREILKKNHQPVLEMLTEREKEVLILLKDGNKAPAIAQALFISYDTVQTHLHHLHEKLQVHTTAALVKAAMEMGL